MVQNTSIKGRSGEDLAILFLKKTGYKIIGKNFRSTFGEIDIIAKKEKYIYFCEVKTRWGSKYGNPEESVNSSKLTKIKKTVDYYLYINNLDESVAKIIVIAQSFEDGLLKNQRIIPLD